MKSEFFVKLQSRTCNFDEKEHTIAGVSHLWTTFLYFSLLYTAIDTRIILFFKHVRDKHAYSSNHRNQNLFLRNKVFIFFVEVFLKLLFLEKLIFGTHESVS